MSLGMTLDRSRKKCRGRCALACPAGIGYG